MQLTNRVKPRMGETWIYITGESYEIVDIEVDSEGKAEEVIYREKGCHTPLWRLDMDDFMATLGEDGETTLCFFQKA